MYSYINVMKLFLLCGIPIFTSPTMSSRPGGLSDAKPSNSEVVEIVTGLKDQIEEKIGKPLEEILVHSFKTQVVAGINYFVKIKTGADEFAHLRIYKHFGGDVSLHDVQVEKGEEEEIGYF